MAGFIEYTHRQIPVSDLELGMYVCELDCAWEDSPFLFQGFPLLTDEDIATVQQHCRFVYVDDTRRVNYRTTPSVNVLMSESGQHSGSRPQPRRLAQEIESAESLFTQGHTLIKSVFDEIILGRGIDTQACRAYVRHCVDSLLRNENALLWLTRIKQRDQYTSEHCLSVSILSIGFARFLNHSDSELEQIGLCGLLHDVGKIKIDSALINKPGRLTDNEFAQMKLHAKLGYELLLSQSDLPPAALDVAHAHHERMDGKGYPRGLRVEQIPYWAKLVSICDCYDAITSHRSYDAARPPKDAIKVLMQGRDTQFDSKLVLRFVEWIGAFPVGTLVTLHTGEVALVLETQRQHRLRPRVVVLRNEHKNPCKPRYLDLSKVCVDGAGNPYRLSDSLPDGSYGIHLSDPEIQALMNSDALEALDVA